MFDKGIRWGYENANNKYTKNYDWDKHSSYQTW